MENVNKDEDVNRIWGNIKHNIQISAKENLGMHEWKLHKPWFDEECSLWYEHKLIEQSLPIYTKLVQ